MKPKTDPNKKRAGVAVDALVRLSVMHAVYVRDEGQEWQIFSGEPDLECAKTTASMLEVTRPNSDVCIVPPNASDQGSAPCTNAANQERPIE
jgi:hypothetical protein